MSAFVTIPGEGYHAAQLLASANNISSAASLGPIDATGEKIAFIGRVWWPEDGSTTKDISGAGFLFGSPVTKAGGSVLTASLQDVDLATGPPYQPDGTPDQSATIANANANFAANAWINVAFGSNRTVSRGDLIALVIEYDGAGRLGADTVMFACGTAPTSGAFGQTGTSILTASWATNVGLPNITLNFTDGSFGKLEGSLPFSAISTTTITSNTTPDEIGIRFDIDAPVKIDGLALYFRMANASGCELVLYDAANTVLHNTVVDINAINASLAARPHWISFAPITLAAGTYRFTVKATVNANTIVPHLDVADANHFKVHPGGINWHWTERTDAGAWTNTTTRRPYFASFRVCAIYDGAGGGGGAGIAVLTGGGLVR